MHRRYGRRKRLKVVQKDDQDESIFLYSTVLGREFNAKNLPLTDAFGKRVRGETSAVNAVLKPYFARPRPFVADASVQPVCEKSKEFSYPSGHAMVGYLTGLVLAQMVPEKSAAIMARAKEFAEHRLVCGVHYPSDIEASHTIALALFGAISVSPKYQSDLAAARAEVRGKLHLVAGKP